jgi:hypothetical protein
MNEIWQALAREAGTSAEHFAIGVTALGKANYAQQAYYSQAFFALTTGIERAAKLTMVVDYSLEHRGAFPSFQMIKDYGHNLKVLLDKADEIAERRGFSDAEDRLPRTSIHNGIVMVLSDFANNLTRYYNLDLITGNPRAIKRVDSVRAWYEQIVIPVLAAHYPQNAKQRHEHNARLIAQMLGSDAKVLYHSETGNLLDSVYEASMQTAITDFAKPYVRMYVMQIARFFSRLLSELSNAARRCQLEAIPELSEFFAIFNNSDEYFRQRKSWSIYQH